MRQLAAAENAYVSHVVQWRESGQSLPPDVAENFAKKNKIVGKWCDVLPEHIHALSEAMRLSCIAGAKIGGHQLEFDPNAVPWMNIAMSVTDFLETGDLSKIKIYPA